MQIIKCMVYKVIGHPGTVTDEELTQIKTLVKAPISDPKPRATLEDEEFDLNVDEAKLVNDMPRNSIVAIPVGPSQQVETLNEMILCYPFFSSHFCLPVKKGEVVWVFVESPFESEEDLGDGPFYWMSRVHGSLLSEDVSFTHYERQFELLNLNISEKDQAEKEVIDLMKNYGPGFPGNMFSDSIKDTAYSSIESDMMPVPRFTKTPGDLVLQGSHNTVISLGTTIADSRDESGKRDQKQSLDLSNSPRNVYDSEFGSSGAIDLVVGRSSILSAIDRLTEEDISIAYGQGGSPVTVLNDLGHYETKKNPTFLDTEMSKEILHPRNFNMQEGDPDIITDASRVYLTMDDEIDSTFGIPSIMANSLYAGEEPEIMGSNAGGDIQQFEGLEPYQAVHPMLFDNDGPAIAVKSKNIRIVARSIDNESRKAWLREDDGDPKDAKEIKLPGEQGSIVLIKEGKMETQAQLESIEPVGDSQQISTGDEEGPFDIEHASETGNGRAVIALGADGTIYIDGPRIVIGSGNEKENGKGTQISLGLDAYEPIVMGKQLNETLKAFMEDVIVFITDTFVNHEHATGAGPSGIAGTGTDAATTPTATQTHGTDIQAMIDRLNLHLSKIGKTK